MYYYMYMYLFGVTSVAFYQTQLKLKQNNLLRILEFLFENFSSKFYCTNVYDTYFQINCVGSVLMFEHWLLFVFENSMSDRSDFVTKLLRKLTKNCYAAVFNSSFSTPTSLYL